MQLITTTELRTKSKNLITALLAGQSVNLIHRSKVIGKVKPAMSKGHLKKINAPSLQRKIDKLPFPRITIKEIDRRYRAAMMKKHGQGLR